MNYDYSDKLEQFQNQYKNRTARVIARRDGNVLYDVLQNDRVIVQNHIVPEHVFDNRYV